MSGRSHLTEVQVERIRYATLAGVSAPDLAAELGVSERTIQRHRRRLGISQPRPPHLTDDQLARIAVMVADGCSHVEIGRTVGCSGSAVTRRFPGTQWSRDQTAEYLITLRKTRSA